MACTPAFCTDKLAWDNCRLSYIIGLLGEAAVNGRRIHMDSGKFQSSM